MIVPTSGFRSVGCALVLAVATLLQHSEVEAQWSAQTTISINDTVAVLNENMGQCLAANGDSVHIVWSDNKTNAIYYRHSFDGGVTWGPADKLPVQFIAPGFPSIAVSGRLVHIAYRDTSASGYMSYYLHSLDGGVTWQPVVSLGQFYWWPSITCSGQKVFIALNDTRSGNSEVFFRRSLDDGTTWDTVQQLSNAAGRSEDPSISASNGAVHLVWNDNRTGIMETWYRRSTDDGATWGAETQLTHSTVFCYFPMVHASGDNLDVVYGDRATGNYQLFLKQSSDRGETWFREQQLTHAGVTSAYPVVAHDGSNVDVVWSTAGGDAYFAHSADGGATFDPFESIAVAAVKPSNTFIVSSSTKLHLIWVDQRDGHRKVYYMNEPASHASVGTAQAATALMLIPNPATNGETMLEFSTASRLGNVSADLYDELGRPLATLPLGSLAKGAHRIPLLLPPNPGIVLLRLRAAGAVLASARIIVAR